MAVYREIESLEEYFVISQNPERPEVYACRREDDFAAQFIQDGSFEVKSLGFSCTVPELHDL